MTDSEKHILDNVLWADRVLKKYKELYLSILSFNSCNNIPFNQKVYNFYNSIETHPICKICGDVVKFHNKKYSTYCSVNCSSSDVELNKIKLDKTKQSLLEKYGVSSPFKIKGVREKIVEGHIEKYGVSNPSKDPIVRLKISNTKLLQTEEIKQEIQRKRKLTSIEKYGVDNVSKLDSIKGKTILSNNGKYGVDFPIQLEEVKQKRRDNYFYEHGVYHHFNNTSILESMQLSRTKTLSDNYVDKLKSSGVNVVSYSKGLVEILCNECNSKFEIIVYVLYQRMNSNIKICTHCNPYYNKTSSHQSEISDFKSEIET